jgi:hypothetical protein
MTFLPFCAGRGTLAEKGFLMLRTAFNGFREKTLIGTEQGVCHYG